MASLVALTTDMDRGSRSSRSLMDCVVIRDHRCWRAHFVQSVSIYTVIVTAWLVVGVMIETKVVIHNLLVRVIGIGRVLIGLIGQIQEASLLEQFTSLLDQISDRGSNRLTLTRSRVSIVRRLVLVACLIRATSIDLMLMMVASEIKIVSWRVGMIRIAI